MSFFQTLIVGMLGAMLVVYAPYFWILLDLSKIKLSLAFSILAIFIAFIFTSLFTAGFERGSRQSIYRNVEFWDLCRSISLIFGIVGFVFGLILDSLWAGISVLVEK